jgi:hypothetical protein
MVVFLKATAAISDYFYFILILVTIVVEFLD